MPCDSSHPWYPRLKCFFLRGHGRLRGGGQTRRSSGRVLEGRCRNTPAGNPKEFSMTDPLSLPAGAIGTATIDGKPVFWSRWEANDVNATSSPISYDDILADLGPGENDPAEVWDRTPDGSWSRREIGPEQWPDVVDACPVGGLLIAQCGYRETYLHEGNFTMLQHTPDGWMLDGVVAPLQLDDPVALRGPLDVLREELAVQFADAFIGELDGPSLDTEDQVRWALVHAFLTGAAS